MIDSPSHAERACRYRGGAILILQKWECRGKRTYADELLQQVLLSTKITPSISVRLAGSIFLKYRHGEWSQAENQERVHSVERNRKPKENPATTTLLQINDFTEWQCCINVMMQELQPVPTKQEFAIFYLFTISSRFSQF